MDRIEQTISSVEVAEMVGKAHNKLMRDIREYIDQISTVQSWTRRIFQ